MNTPETRFDAGLKRAANFVRYEGGIPLVVFVVILAGAGLILLTTPFASAWFLFFIGLYPGAAQSGQPDYEFGEKFGFIAFGIFMALVYVGLLISSKIKKTSLLAWLAVILMCISGLGGCLRVLSGIPG